MSVTRVTIHTGAVRSLLNEGGVMAELQKHCEAAAERCNGLVEWHSPMPGPAFKAVVDNAPFTAVGKVVMAPSGHPRQGYKATAMYEAKHKVLLRGCGW